MKDPDTQLLKRAVVALERIADLLGAEKKADPAPRTINSPDRLTTLQSAILAIFQESEPYEELRIKDIAAKLVARGDRFTTAAVSKCLRAGVLKCERGTKGWVYVGDGRQPQY